MTPVATPGGADAIRQSEEETAMLDNDGTTLTDGPRELIARLAAAVMIADGHISESELCVVDHLRELGLGPLSTFIDAEVQRATRTPIDVAGTATALAAVAPQAGDVVVSALAQIAASDRELSRGELEVLSVVAEVLGLNDIEAAHAIRSAAARYGAAIADQTPAPATVSPQIKPVPGPEAPRVPEPLVVTPPMPNGARAELDRALPVLGLAAGASADEMDAAYATFVRRYNPAGVIELGPEFAVLAVQRLNAITNAYVAARQALAGC